MTQVNWMIGELEIEVAGFFTTHHTVKSEVGIVGEFTFPAFSQHAVYRATDGRELHMQKTHWWAGAHELIDGEIVRGTADRAGFFRRDMIVQFDGQEYGLEPEGFFKQGWYLVSADGTKLVEIQPRGVLKQGAYLWAHTVVEAELVAFAYYLVHMRKQEEAAAAAASAS
jgi:hypothetical protein